jgi:glycosyltransferase involved in cell wall biosynthesis
MIHVHSDDSVRLTTVLPTLLCGGTEKQVMMLTRRLADDRFAIDFACLRRRGPFVDELLSCRIPITEYRMSGFWSVRALLQQVKLANDLRRNRTQIVHSYGFYGNVFGLAPARAAGVPVTVASIRDRGPYLTPMQRRVQRYACQLADCVLVNATAVREWLIADGYHPGNIVTIPNGVDVRLFERPHDPEWIHRAFGFPAGSPIVAVVSRLAPRKGLEQFVAAAAVVAQRIPAARFLVVGEANPLQPDYGVEIEELVRARGLSERVTFAGFRDDIPALLASVSVSVNPSLDEALSNSLLESMAAGVPVVATRVGGTPEALTDGEHGLLVPPGDVPALANAMTNVLENADLARRLARAGRTRVCECYSVDRMVAATERLYDELLARKAGLRRRAAAVVPSVDGPVLQSSR